jgi:dynein heavy chain
MSKKVNLEFRIFLTAATTPDFPITILQQSIKLTKDPPKGVKANIIQIYQNQCATKQERKFYDEMSDDRKEDWGCLYMSLAYFHSIIRERRRFGPIGWNNYYDYNESDFKISVKQLNYMISNFEKIPYKALISLTGDCYYGGKVTDTQDRRLLLTLLKDFYNPKVVGDMYAFSEIIEMCIPDDCVDLDNCLEFLQALPDTNDPRLYGLHPNASISSAIFDADFIVKSILDVDQGSGKGASSERSKELMNTVKLLQGQVPSVFDLENAKAKNPITYEDSMGTVLYQELLRYNR